MPLRRVEGWDTGLPSPVDYEEFISGKSTGDWPVLDENSPLGLCYTSGTTGNPKGVEYEHRSQYLHTMAMCMTDSMGLSATDTVCGIVPMFHAMGWGILGGSDVGLQASATHRFMDPARLLQLMVDEGVTLSAGVPTIWQGVKGLYEANPGAYDLSNLSRLTCGGSAPALFNTLVLGSAGRRDDSGVGHDRNFSACNAVEEGDETLSVRIRRRSIV